MFLIVSGWYSKMTEEMMLDKLFKIFTTFFFITTKSGLLLMVSNKLYWHVLAFDPLINELIVLLLK